MGFRYQYWALIWCSLSACHPTGSTHSHDEPGILNGARLSQTLSETFCARFVECKLDIKPFYVFFPELCEQLLRAQFRTTLSPLDELMAEGHVALSNEGFVECLRAMNEVSCLSFDVQDYEEACAEVFRGSRPLGDVCFRTEECSEGYCASGSACPGTCAPLSQIGETCAEGGERQCAAGLDCGPDDLCFEKSGNILRGLEGQLCQGSTCAPGLTCLATDPRRCADYDTVFRVPEGMPCGSLNAPADTPRCAPGFICVFSSPTAARGEGICAAVPKESEPCALATVAPIAWCAAGAYCKGVEPGEGEYTGICHPLPKEGEGCGTLLGSKPVCGEGLECDAATCVIPRASGASCSNPEACLSGHCENGVCALGCDIP